MGFRLFYLLQNSLDTILQLNNISKLSGFIDKKIFAVTYLQLSGNHVKFYMNCVNKRRKISLVSNVLQRKKVKKSTNRNDQSYKNSQCGMNADIINGFSGAAPISVALVFINVMRFESR